MGCNDIMQYVGIPVENFDSKKVLHAEIVDSRTVKIEF